MRVTQTIWEKERLMNPPPQFFLSGENVFEVLGLLFYEGIFLIPFCLLKLKFGLNSYVNLFF